MLELGISILVLLCITILGTLFNSIRIKRVNLLLEEMERPSKEKVKKEVEEVVLNKIEEIKDNDKQKLLKQEKVDALNSKESESVNLGNNIKNYNSLDDLLKNEEAFFIQEIKFEKENAVVELDIKEVEKSKEKQ